MKKEQIIKYWLKKQLKHPTYQEVADKYLVSRQYVAQVVEKYLLEQKALGREIE
jgi:hypothetical protein